MRPVVTAPYWSDGTCSLYLGDSRDVLAGLPDDSVEAVVTDPPYELGFMGKTWDASGIAYNVELWKHCWRVLKPGGHLVAFGGTRTYHRMVCAIEDANFEIRDSMHWIYGSGFPKSMDVGKAIDKAAGAERVVVGLHPSPAGNKPGGASLNMSARGMPEVAHITAPATDAARRWSGWGTALKPSHEPIVLARKPLGGTVASTVLEHGTGALNIEGCRVDGPPPPSVPQPVFNSPTGRTYGMKTGEGRNGDMSQASSGRWPTNLVLTHSATCAEACAADCPVAELDRQGGHLKSGANPTRRRSDNVRDAYGDFAGQEQCTPARGADDGGASRFFPVFRYEAKAPAIERPRLADGTAHTTVKPLTLMRWLVRLVTPPGGTVLDPFAGSGTTGEACAIEGFQSLLIEQDPAHAELIKTRLAKPMQAVLGFEEPA